MGKARVVYRRKHGYVTIRSVRPPKIKKVRKRRYTIFRKLLVLDLLSQKGMTLQKASKQALVPYKTLWKWRSLQERKPCYFLRKLKLGIQKLGL